MDIEAASSGSVRLKVTSKRPDSLRVELLNTIPEEGRAKELGNTTADVDNVPLNVGFRNISYTVVEGLFRRRRRKLLDKVNGDFSGGELTAIMGPSGSGKSTLMNILAGYTTTGVIGERLLNDEKRDETSFRRQSCYIMQDDNLQPLLTVYEAMMVAANLKLCIAPKEKQMRVKEILESIGLWEHKKVKTSSLSGGQRKRLSIALELLKNPQVMFFDEPTSGLDSLTSKQCVMLLKQLAATGRTIVCTIHQPSAIVFEMFDHLYVLGKGGKCVYQGAIKGLGPFLERIALRCPPYHNPADFLLEVVSGEYGDYTQLLAEMNENGLSHTYRKTQRDTLQLQSIEQIDKMMQNGRITPVRAPSILFPKVKSSGDKKSATNVCCRDSYSTTGLTQLAVLLKRTYLILSRDRTLAYSRLITHTGIALFIGILYYGIGKDASNVLNNFNFMFFSVMFLMLTAFNCVTTTFPYELPILTREHFNKWYSLKTYYLAISLADIPVQIIATVIYALVTYALTMQPVEPFRLFSFLFMCILISLVAQSFGLFIGACMDIKNGVIFGPFCFLPFTIFSGFFVQLNDCHPYMRWLFHISFLKYGFEGLVLSVLGYERQKLPCNAEYCHFVYPNKFLSQMDMEEANYSTAVFFLVGLFLVIRLAAYFALSIQIKRSRSRRT